MRICSSLDLEREREPPARVDRIVVQWVFLSPEQELPMTAPPRTTPELMAPAGDWDSARAAVENGADAVYFGLQNGFNARARAANFTDAELPELMTFLRTRGVRGYLTLNTLIFDDELVEAERVARLVVAAGVDAVLVQDLGLLRLLHRLCPELPLHASTQMTLSSAECIGEVESLGVRRVVLPRELSIDQIAAIHRQTGVELEAFVHGALCISYSGQCLASLSMGGRSANRGQCAQPCRLPYEVLCDGGPSDAADKKYPLSPHDLAAFDRLPELIAAGVSALKIEGRLKPPEYVASVTRHYRAALDAAVQNLPSPTDTGEMEQTFSRGFCHGWLDGTDHRSLVSGLGSAKRGTLLGQVRGVRGERIVVELAATAHRGDGVVFEGDRSQAAEQGGRVYEIFQNGRSIENEIAEGCVELAFQYGSIDRSAIQLGQNVWKTDDPRATRRLRQTFASGHPQRCVPLDLVVEAAVGEPLRVAITSATGAEFRLESPEPLPLATKHPLTPETLREQFGRLGKTPYELRRLDAKLDGRAMIPLSELGKLRHAMVERLDAAAARPTQRVMLETSALAAVRDELEGERGRGGEGEKNNANSISLSPPLPLSLSPTLLHVLCRSMDQLDAALECGVRSVIADFRETGRYGNAVRTARRAGASILLATTRIHRPGESDAFRQLADEKPDGVLARNLAALGFCRRAGMPAVADFSLNAANDLAVEWLHTLGARRVTAAYDLNHQRLLDLAAAVPPELLEVVVHRHTPMFHTEYCLFCGNLSQGSSPSDCGQPCRRHAVRLRDRLGVEHYLTADSRCRNTVFHAEAESGLKAMPSLIERGVRHFRVELLMESGVDDVRRVLTAYRRICEK